MPAGRRAGNPEPFRIDVVLGGMLLDITDTGLDVCCHFQSSVARAGSGPDSEHGVTSGAITIIDLRQSVLAQLATVRVPGAADHVNDAQAVRVGFGGKNIHEQAGAVLLSKNEIDFLLVWN